MARRESNAAKRADLGYFAGLFAEAVRRGEPWQEALKGWNMIESKFMNEVARQIVEKAEERAKVKARIESIQELLLDRVGPPPADLIVAINAITDQARLSQLLRLAGRATNFEQFRQDAGL